MSVRAAVIDAHHHRLARLLVRDPDLGAERQSLVGGGQVVGVEALAVGRLLAVKAGAYHEAAPVWIGLLSSAAAGAARAPPRRRAVMARALQALVMLSGFLSCCDAQYSILHRNKSRGA